MWTITDALQHSERVRESPALAKWWASYANKAEARGLDRAAAIRYAGACLHRQLGRARAARKRAAMGFSALGRDGRLAELFDDAGEQSEIRRAGARQGSPP